MNVAKGEQGQLTIFDFEDCAMGFGFIDSMNFAKRCNMSELGFPDISYESLVPFVEVCAPGIDEKRLKEYYPWLDALYTLRSA